MTGWLLDTYVISELRRPKPSPRVIEFVRQQPIDLLYVSTVTLAEIRFGIETLSEPLRRAELLDWLNHRVRPMFQGRILGVSEDVMFKWRLLVEEGRRIRHTFSQPDLIIAATALQHGLTIVTRNSPDYAQTHAPILDPWQDEPASTSP